MTTVYAAQAHKAIQYDGTNSAAIISATGVGGPNTYGITACTVGSETGGVLTLNVETDNGLPNGAEFDKVIAETDWVTYGTSGEPGYDAENGRGPGVWTDSTFQAQFVQV